MKKYATVDTAKSTRILTSALTWFFLRTVPSSRNAKPACIASTMIAPSRMNSVSALARSDSIGRYPLSFCGRRTDRYSVKFSSDIERTGKRRAGQHPRAVRAGRQQQLALGRQRFEVVAEHPEQGVVEAQHVDRRHDLAVLDPERRETRHPGHPARGTVRIIEVPQVADGESRVERGERIVRRDRAAADRRALRAIRRRWRHWPRARIRARSAARRARRTSGRRRRAARFPVARILPPETVARRRPRSPRRSARADRAAPSTRILDSALCCVSRARAENPPHASSSTISCIAAGARYARYLPGRSAFGGALIERNCSIDARIRSSSAASLHAKSLYEAFTALSARW